jgi:hypothetical protein
LKNGAIPVGVLETPLTLSLRWSSASATKSKNIQGTNRGRVAILEQDLKWKDIAIGLAEVMRS